MPVITFKYDDLKELGIDIDKDKLINIIPMMGSDIEDHDDDEIKVEFFPNRPDNLSVPGVARSLKGFLSLETGLPEYEVSPSNEKVFVSKEVEEIRPYIAFAKIEGVNFNDTKLKQIMDFQENLHWVIGRDRKKVAIGIHNANVINSPYNYIATNKNENSFIPLEEDKTMTPEEVLENIEKGSKYAHLIDKFDKYPMILDKDNQILSMPPIINGELTKLSENTTNILVDVTGTDEKAVNQSLNIICSSFAEVGGQIKSLEIIYENKSIVTPNLQPKTKIVHVSTTNELIGIDINAEQTKKLLEKARMGASIINEDELEVKIPAYRIDILHEYDIVENIAIQYCINKIDAKLPDLSTVAYEHNWFKSDKTLREIMIGLGYQEVMSLMLTSEDSHYVKMNRPEDEHVQVARPITIDGTMIRKSIINTLMEFLEDNKHQDLPQKIFEIGDILYIDESETLKVRPSKKFAALSCHSTANFTEAKSLTLSVLNNLGYNIEIGESKDPSFIPGRVASVSGTSKNGKISGVFGELSPKVITNFDLDYPVVGFELEFI
jgi:phenylalanyl-tRNA synthetase beta chain